MAATEKNGSKRRVVRRLLGALLSLILMAAVYVAAVLIHFPTPEDDSYVVEEEQEEVTRLQPAASADVYALARLFGSRLPVLSGAAMTGETLNAVHDGRTARMAVLRFSGFTVTAVRPASAAPLLMRGEMSVELRSGLEVQNLPVMLCTAGDALCAYFADEGAAYSIYAPKAAREDFLSLLERIEWAQ